MVVVVEEVVVVGIEVADGLPFELLESLRPRTVEAPEVKEDRLRAGEVPRFIVSVPEELLEKSIILDWSRIVVIRITECEFTHRIRSWWSLSWN